MKKFKKVIEMTLAPAEVITEDGGCAKIVNVVDEPDEEKGIFIRLQSWDESKEHKDFHQLEGKKVRITIETIK
jgi:hypothetical protein